MPVDIRSKEDLEKMRIAGKLAAQVLEMIEPFVEPGVSTEYLDSLCFQYMTRQQRAIPACLGYRGFPKTICTSINQVVCHGIPSEKKFSKMAILLIST